MLNNSVIISIIMAAITYFYVSWNYKQKIKKNPELEKKNIDFILPFIMGGIAWCVMSTFKKTNISSNKYVLKESDSLLETESLKLIGRTNVNIPNSNTFLNLSPF